MFSDSDSESDQNVKLTINEHYAKAFEHRKEREELEKLKAKYGSDFEEGDLEESTDSESAESEDEDGEELTPAVDAAIMRTLARIRKKDPAIYDSGKNIFGEEADKVSTATAPTKKQKKDKSKPVTLRQQNLDAVLHGSRSPSPEPAVPTHVQEQEALRDETIKAFETAIGDDDDDFLVPREKTRDEVELEEEEYKAFLEKHVGDDLRDMIQIDSRVEEEEGSQGDDEEEGEKKSGKKREKKDKKRKDKGKAKQSKEADDQEFLLNYILNRGWVDKSERRVPTYHEITGDGKKKGKGKEKAPVPSSEESEDNAEDDGDGGLLSDASFESLASVFEVSYNHRFEEPGADTIPSFPRHIESTIRREENPRKAARERKKARKEEEMAKKREEVKRMKSLKMKEIKRKLEAIGMESGLLKGPAKKGGEGRLDEALQELDLEGEWDPEKHDQQLQTLFGGEGDEGEGGDEVDDPYMRFEDGKPVWDDDIDLGDIPFSDDDAVPVSKKSKKEKKKEKKKKKKKGGEDDGEGVDVDAMDADMVAEPNFDEEWDGTEEMRKRKWKEYMDSLYELDFNDMVGDMTTRFKYVPVGKQNYSLDPVEILMANDKDLNEYMSIKKYAPYRQERGDRSKWDKRQQDKLKDLKETLKKKQRAFGHYDPNGGVDEGRDGENGDKPKKKRMGKKERMKAKTAEAGEEGEDGANEEAEADEPAPAASSSEKKRKRENGEEKEEVAAAPEVESGARPDDGAKRKKRRRRNKKTEGAAEES